MSRLAALAVAVVALALVPARAQAAETFVVAGPGAFALTYATPVAVVEPGGSLTFVNLEFEKHDVVQDVYADGVAGSADESWCSRFPVGGCPLFWSDQIRVFQRTTPVLGIDNLDPGGVYSFYCTVHPFMKGKLAVLP